MAPVLMARRRWITTELSGELVLKINIAYYNLGYVIIDGIKSPVSIDWGDGTSDSSDEIGGYLAGSHVYEASEGVFIIRVTGTASRVNFGPPNITDVLDWGNLNVDYASGMLSSQPNLTEIASPITGLSNVTEFDSFFAYCTSLTAIPAGLFDNCANANVFYRTFFGCASLASLPDRLFANCANAYVFVSTFEGCASLVDIPTGLFASGAEGLIFNSVFANCTSLTLIANGLFSDSTTAQSFDSAFANCASLGEIPSGLFDNCPHVYSFSSAFANCSSLTNLPNKLFYSNQNVTDYSNVFYNTPLHLDDSQQLFNSEHLAMNYPRFANAFASDTVKMSGKAPALWENYPEGWWDTCGGFNCFAGQTELENYADIPLEWGGETSPFIAKVDLSTGRSLMISFSNVRKQGIIDWGDGNTETVGVSSGTVNKTHVYGETGGIKTVIISGVVCDQLYRYSYSSSTSICMTEVVSWGNMGIRSGANVMTYQTTLVTVPSPITGMQRATSFSGAFSWCNSLTSIPAGLFDNCPNVTTFSYAFENCTSVTSIPANLFANCPNVTDFTATFDYCYSITTIPDGLFDSCPNVRTFALAFEYCNRITSIPSGLFDYCPYVTTFYRVFDGCQGITSIPTGLFDNCSRVTNFSFAFRSLRSLTSIPVGLFDNCPNVKDFQHAFDGCTSITSNVPRLWETHPNATGLACFRGCTNAANYAEIPDNWK